MDALLDRIVLAKKKNKKKQKKKRNLKIENHVLFSEQIWGFKPRI